MERATNTRGPSHQEHPIATGNGFFAIVLALVLLAGGAMMLWQSLASGYPVEIAAVVVWHVEDSAKAAFDVDDYEMFVKVQSESAVRHLASSFAYDAEEKQDIAREPTLLESADVVARALVKELQARLEQAGVVVEEARLTHLAYAPEIAQVMLRRQQAEAIIAARQKIVHGAVSMVEMALTELSAKKVVELDDERRASMVSNLMVVLCAESEVQPVINTGTLYT